MKLVSTTGTVLRPLMQCVHAKAFLCCWLSSRRPKQAAVVSNKNVIQQKYVPPVQQSNVVMIQIVIMIKHVMQLLAIVLIVVYIVVPIVVSVMILLYWSCVIFLFVYMVLYLVLFGEYYGDDISFFLQNDFKISFVFSLRTFCTRLVFSIFVCRLYCLLGTLNRLPNWQPNLC